MNPKVAKRKASAAVREIILAARKYIEAEKELERSLRAEQEQKNDDSMKATGRCSV